MKKLTIIFILFVAAVVGWLDNPEDYHPKLTAQEQREILQAYNEGLHPVEVVAILKAPKVRDIKP